MKTSLSFFVLFSLTTAVASANDHFLWEIGNADGDNAEFALAPKSYRQFAEDAVYIVGYSTPKQDWPYVHPGPVDDWAGSRAHTFTIIFGVKRAATSGDCKLILDLLDTQSKSPPTLVIDVNGQRFERHMSPGTGDISVEGQPGNGKPRHIAVTFPAALLKQGDNQIAIASIAGSWMLYDHIALRSPIELEAAPPTNRVCISSIQSKRALVELYGRFYQPVDVLLAYAGEPLEASLNCGTTVIGRVRLRKGTQRVEALVPAVEKATSTEVTLVAQEKVLASRAVTIEPVRRVTVYILMHSHNDIGFTDIQPNIAKKQAQNVLRALELIRQTKDYSAGARFKWNLEVLMPYEDFHQVATPKQERELEQAVRDGNIGIDAMYANLLTGVCRSEELLRQFSFAVGLGGRCGVKVDSMMISDVPGLTWGVVPALVQNGVKYISAGPNANPANMEGDRIGYVREEWEYKPFYWLAPSGREKVLYWAALGGYSIGHGHRSVIDAVSAISQRLAQVDYPYDIVQLRWSKGDNGRPDEGVMDAVRDWNAKYAFPRLVIATTSEAFHAFEKRYGPELPTYRGDLTPYWEDGTGSAARETAMNRHSADRLLQAETLWAMLRPGRFPATDFEAAWKNVALWSEHTWGAHNSISAPDLPFVKAQWGFKQAFAVDADRQARALMDKALRGAKASAPAKWDVFNTSSWPRTDLVTLPKETKGDGVKDELGRLVPSQRLSTGELVFLARDVPPFAARRFTVDGSAAPAGHAQAEGATLKTRSLGLRLDAATGAIASLMWSGLAAELANGQINSYFYLPGADVNDAKPNGPATISVRDSGPLLASLVAESDAPGCQKLVREVRVVDGLDRVEIIDSLDKKRVRAVEGVHFGFSFNVPSPEVRINSPGAVVRPEQDQLPGACKNWFSVERWVDISNKDYGVTWITADAPLVEIGGLTANLPRTQPNPNVYIKHIEPSATLYSWVMNNHWHTNYRADQEGWVTFRYAIQPHKSYDAAAAARFGIENTQPLIVAPAMGEKPAGSRVRIEPADVLVTALKPSDDGRGIVLRLYGASGKDTTATVSWSQPVPSAVWLSDASEQPLKKAGEAVDVRASGIVTLRAELP
jgi:alpha-mannosidase